MSTQTDKATVRRYFEGDHDGRDNVENWDEVCDPSMTLYATILPQPVQGLEANKQFTASMHSAMADFSITVDDLIAEGDQVVARWTMRGTHVAPLPLPTGMLPPTGRKIDVTGVSILRLAGGKITEERVEGDWLGFLQQLGVIPAP